MTGLEKVWQQARENHAKYSATGDREHEIRFFALGLAGEAGEVANFVKKRWRDGDHHDEALRKECADVLAYTMMLADALGMTPDDLVEMVAYKQSVFIANMEARHSAPGRREVCACQECGGTGRTDSYQFGRGLLLRSRSRCSACKGTGKVSSASAREEEVE